MPAPAVMNNEAADEDYEDGKLMFVVGHETLWSARLPGRQRNMHSIQHSLHSVHSYERDRSRFYVQRGCVFRLALREGDDAANNTTTVFIHGAFKWT